MGRTYRRITKERIEKWALTMGISGISIVVLIFGFLIFMGDIDIISHSGDSICAGTLDDPCYAYLNFTMNKDYIYLYPYDWQAEGIFYTKPSAKEVYLEVRDRRTKTGWRRINLSEKSSHCQREGCNYAYRFYKTKGLWEIRFVGYKNNPSDNIKWGFGRLDPEWIGKFFQDPNSFSLEQSSTTRTGDYRIYRKDGNESFYTVEFEKVKVVTGQDIFKNNIFREDTLVKIKVNFENKNITVNDKIGAVIGSYIYEVPESMKLVKEKKDTSYIQRTLEKDNPLSLTPDDFEKDDEYVFSYQANPNEDFHLKFGEDSIEIVQVEITDANTININVTTETNFSHLSISNEDPYDNLVLYYPFDSNISQTTVYDYSGNNIDGELQNGVTYNESGLYGGAMVFNKTVQQRIYVPFSQDINITNNLTVSMWFKENELLSGYSRLFFRYNSYFDLNTYDGKIKYYFNNASSDAFGWTTATGSDFTANTWNHLTVVYNNSMHIFMNGVLVYDGVKESGDLRVATTSYLYIGGFTTITNFNGTLDEVMIFNKSLSPTEISNIYNNQSARFRNEGTSIFQAQYLTEEKNRINVTLETKQFFNTNVSVRLGVNNWTDSYNDTDENLVLSFHFDNKTGYENATHVFDFSEEGNNGTAVGVYYNITGRYGGGFEFNVKGDRIRASPISGKGNQITLAGWFKWRYTANSKYGGIITNIGTTYQNGSGIIMANGKVRFQVYNTTSGHTIYSNDELNDTKWHHTIGVYDGMNMSLYIDGVKQTQTFNVSNSEGFSSVNNFTIGNYYSSYFDPTLSLNGTLDEIRIYNKSLSATEVKELYLMSKNIYHYTEWQNFSDGVSTREFEVAGNTSIVSPEVRLFGSDYQFYSPLLMYNLTLTGFNVSEIEEECNPTLNEDWVISDTQVCDGKEVTTGIGDINITSPGTLTLINGANVSTQKLNIKSTGDQVFVDSGCELKGG